MKLIIQLTALLLPITIATSCDQDLAKNDNKTNTELLTPGKMKLTAATINPAYDYYSDGNSVTNIFDILQTCEKDDFETYKTNGT